MKNISTNEKVEKLEDQYVFVLSFMIPYNDYAARIFRRIRLRALLGSKKVEDALTNQIILKYTVSCNLIHPEMKKLIERYAKDDEKSSTFFDVIMSGNPYEALALKIEAQCPDIDFAKIAKLHESRDKRYWWTNLKVLITGVLGIGLFFLNTVPDVFIERLGGSVDICRLYVFLATASIVFLVLFYWTLLWLTIGRRWISARRFVSDALNYLAIMKT